MELTKERGCGSRKKGGVYLTVAEGPGGKPIEHFLIDPPIPVDLQQLGIGPRGIHLVERNGVWHVFDVVGTKHYPNVADYVWDVGNSRASASPKANAGAGAETADEAIELEITRQLERLNQQLSHETLKAEKSRIAGLIGVIERRKRRTA